jgi:hypothetical protein
MYTHVQKNQASLTSLKATSLVPRLSPSSFFFTRYFMYAEFFVHAREGESLGGFDHVRTPMTCSESTVSTYTCTSPKERERGPDQRTIRFFGVLLATDGSIAGQDYQQTF